MTAEGRRVSGKSRSAPASFVIGHEPTPVSPGLSFVAMSYAGGIPQLVVVPEECELSQVRAVIGGNPVRLSEGIATPVPFGTKARFALPGQPPLILVLTGYSPTGFSGRIESLALVH